MKYITILAAVFALTACSAGNLTAIHKKAVITSDGFGTDEGQPVGIFVDAEQRAVLSAVRPSVTTTTFDYRSGAARTSFVEERTGNRVICAEPAPDALSAIAAQSGVSVSQLNDAVSAEGALSEVAANIGVRTQTIQTLRDGFYRVCEAYMNGLSDEQYSIMLRRFQTNMIALLAIEQLTGAVRGGDALVGASAGDLDVVDGAGGERYGRRGVGNTAETGGVVGSWPPFRDQNAGVAVAQAVENISLALINQDYGVQLCLEYLRAGIKDTPLKENCLAVVAAYANGLQAQITNETEAQSARIQAEARMTQARANILEAAAFAIRTGTMDQTQLEGVKTIIQETSPNTPPEVLAPIAAYQDLDGADY
ncbi:MAG: hypothetical protein AAGI14_04370 [Pseudomonadota bacterium]